MPFSKNTTTKLCHLLSPRAYDVYSVWGFVDFAVLTVTLVTQGTKIQKTSVCVGLCNVVCDRRESEPVVIMGVLIT